MNQQKKFEQPEKAIDADASDYVDNPAEAVKKAVEIVMLHGGQAGLYFAQAFEKAWGVSYDDIAEACSIQYDDHYRNPFEEDEWLEHTLRPVRHDGEMDSHAYIYVDRQHQIIEVNDDCDEKWYQAQGATKQAAKQLAAKQKRARVERIADIYRDGVEYYGVVCDFTAPDGHEYHDSCWGFEGHDFAEENREEIIGNVVRMLENDGWVVDGKPETVDRMANRRETLKWKANMFNL